MVKTMLPKTETNVLNALFEDREGVKSEMSSHNKNQTRKQLGMNRNSEIVGEHSGTTNSTTPIYSDRARFK